MAITISDIITEHGAYYKKGGQGEQNLVAKFYEKSETEQLFTRVITEATVYDTAGIDTTRVVQPYQDTFTPLGGMTFTPEKIQLYEQKIDTQENPSKIEASWLGFLANDKSRDRKEWPLIRYWLEWILAQKNEDIEVNEIYSAIYAAPTPGTAGAAGTSMHGLQKVFVDSLARSGSNKVTLVTTGALESDAVDFVTQVETFIDTIPDKYKDSLGPIVMSKANRRKFIRGNRAKYNINYDQKEDLTTVQDYELPVVSVRSMQGKDRIWTTVKGNGIVAVKAPAGENMLQVESVDRNVKAWTDWWKGIGFRYHPLVFVNDQT